MPPCGDWLRPQARGAGFDRFWSLTLWIWKEKRRRRRSSDGVMPIDRLLTNAVFFEDTMYVVQVGFRAGLDDVYGNLSIIRILRLMRCHFFSGMGVL